MLESSSIKNKALHGIFWTYLAYYSGKFFVFVSTIVLARILSQDEFGVAAFALTVMSFLEVLADMGITSALIYHRDEPGAADTAFWLGIFLGLGLTCITWIMAPLIGSFFHDARAIPVVRALVFTLPATALGNVHAILLRKELSFQRKFFPSIVHFIVKGIASIAFAMAGFSFWSLIIGQLAGVTASTIALWFAHPWRPSFHFIWNKSREFLKFGMHIVVINAINIVLVNTDYLVIGRFMDATALGVYTLAFRIPDLVIVNFCSLIGYVIFPLYSKLRDDSYALTRGFLMTTRYVAFVTVPISLGMILVARPLVLTVFGQKWLEAVPVLQAISVYSLMLSLAFNAGDFYKAQGRPEILTRVSFFRMLVLIPGLYWAASQAKSITAVGWTHAAVAFVFGLISMVIASKLLHATLKELAEALRPAILAGLVMGVFVLLVNSITRNSSDLVQLIVAIAVGGFTYIATLWIIDRPMVLETVRILRGALEK